MLTQIAVASIHENFITYREMGGHTCACSDLVRFILLTHKKNYINMKHSMPTRPQDGPFPFPSLQSDFLQHPGLPNRKPIKWIS